MDSSIVHYIIGAGGAASLTLLLIMLGELVLKREYRKLADQNAKLQQANDVLTAALANERDLNSRLASSGALTNQLVSALIGIAHERAARAGVAPDPGIPAITESL